MKKAIGRRRGVMTLLEKLKELSAQATPGPWEVSKNLPWVVVSPEPAKLGEGHVYVSCACGGGNNEGNSAYLASALNALPALIAVAEAAKWVMETTDHAYVLNQAAVKGALKRLDTALAKLEVEA